MARWALLTFGFLCLVPPTYVVGLFLFASSVKRIEHFPDGHVVETLSVQMTWPPVVGGFALGVILIVAGLMLPYTESRG